MQYKIPQNVDVEDKIFGPLSIRQFTWLVIGGFLCFVLYLLLGKQSFFLFFVAALPVAAAFGALAFAKINERPFELFLVSSSRAFLRPRRRIWMRIGEPETIILVHTPKLAHTLAAKPGLDEVRGQLEELTMVVDTRGWGKASDASQAFTEERIVSTPEAVETAEPEPADPVEVPTVHLDQSLEEAGRAAVARIRKRASVRHEIIPDDPSRHAFTEEVATQGQTVTPPVGKYRSPEEMRAALRSYQSGEGTL